MAAADVTLPPNVQKELDAKAEKARQAQLRRDAVASIRPLFGADDVELSDHDLAAVAKVFDGARQRKAALNRAAAVAEQQQPRRRFASLAGNRF